MNQGLPTYSNFVSNGNRQISAKYVVNNLVMCENRVNTHILIARVLQMFKGTLASRNTVERHQRCHSYRHHTALQCVHRTNYRHTERHRRGSENNIRHNRARLVWRWGTMVKLYLHYAL